MNRIEKKFSQLKKSNQKAFIVFITAGYPNLNLTYKLILEFSRIGVDIVELGVPFSDPIADGPVIQESSQVALDNQINLNDIFSLVKRVRKYTDIPICLMTYYNPIFCFGEERFMNRATAVGVDGVIIPDLPPEEAVSLIKLARKANLDTIFFISPTTTLSRIKFIAKVSRGFIYYVSLTGVTGPRQNLAKDLVTNLKRIKQIISKPVCVGFGVSSSKQIKQIYNLADGVIVGSVIIKKIKENLNKKDLIKILGRFVAKLKYV